MTSSVLTVRRAVDSDAVSACDVLRKSILELCQADHEGDALRIKAWLDNKTPENVRAWIASEQCFSVVVVRDAEIVGFGLISRDGEVRLCYVHPEARFQGASTLMLAALEERASLWGLSTVVLTSSLTARRFYESRGYASSGEPVQVFGSQRAYPMRKPLDPSRRT